MKIPTDLNPLALKNDDIYLTFRAIEQNSTLKITKSGTVNTSKLYYSKNNNNWTLYEIDQIITLNPRRYT